MSFNYIAWTAFEHITPIFLAIFFPLCLQLYALSPLHTNYYKRADFVVIVVTCWLPLGLSFRFFVVFVCSHYFARRFFGLFLSLFFSLFVLSFLACSSHRFWFVLPCLILTILLAVVVSNACTISNGFLLLSPKSHLCKSREMSACANECIAIEGTQKYSKHFSYAVDETHIHKTHFTAYVCVYGLRYRCLFHTTFLLRFCKTDFSDVGEPFATFALNAIYFNSFDKHTQQISLSLLNVKHFKVYTKPKCYRCGSQIKYNTNKTQFYYFGQNGFTNIPTFYSIGLIVK